MQAHMPHEPHICIVFAYVRARVTSRDSVRRTRAMCIYNTYTQRAYVQCTCVACRTCVVCINGIHNRTFQNVCLCHCVIVMYDVSSVSKEIVCGLIRFRVGFTTVSTNTGPLNLKGQNVQKLKENITFRENGL